MYITVGTTLISNPALFSLAVRKIARFIWAVRPGGTALTRLTVPIVVDEMVTPTPTMLRRNSKHLLPVLLMALPIPSTAF